MTCCFTWFTGLALVLACATSAAAPLPSGSDVMRRFVERVNAVAQSNAPIRYAYDKKSVTQELDAGGKPSKTTEKLYAVTLIGGLPFQRLVKVQGRDLTPGEIEKENQRETAFRQKLSGVDIKKKSANKEGMVTQELIDRFEFQVTKRERAGDRDILVLVFKPKPGQPEKTLQDKLLNRFSGTLWVDEQESEMTKLDCTMAGSVSIGWLGVAEVYGPAAGIQAVNEIEGRDSLESYYLLYAILAEFEAQQNNVAAAAAHFRKAIGLADLKSEQALLMRRLAECAGPQWAG